jgi:hypothetical protein
MKYIKRIQNQTLEEEQTTQWPKEKVQKDKQRSAKYTHITKVRVTRTPIKTGCEPYHFISYTFCIDDLNAKPFDDSCHNS